ncbi:MAG: tyrosine--tRNA ligase [Gemmatimonadetes bacterium]|nr:MAG: tyrosine--tRNA ligase [Gemmatimonadota bacterium]
MTLDQQIAAIKRGTQSIIPEAELRQKLEKSQKTGKPLKVKLGLDPTAPDIHLGFAVVLRKLRLFQDLGHEVIIIIGDFTASIGDPSGKSKTRPQLSPQEIAENAKTYADQYSKILDREKTTVRFNSEWLQPLDFADIIRLASKLTVARILERDDFQNRLKEGRELRLHEILYPVCQAYDSVALESDIEMGGTDQMFNILLGRDLQREFGQDPQIGLFMPLLVGTDGTEKMSKSLGNYIGIHEPPAEMYGKTLSIPDSALYTYYELASDVSDEELAEIKVQLETGTANPRDLKRRLARNIVAQYHSEDAAYAAEAEFDRIFIKKSIPEDIPEYPLREKPARLIAIMVDLEFAKSNGEARRLIRQGGVYLNEERVQDENLEITGEQELILKVGKRKFARLLP